MKFNRKQYPKIARAFAFSGRGHTLLPYSQQAFHGWLWAATPQEELYSITLYVHLAEHPLNENPGYGTA